MLAKEDFNYSALQKSILTEHNRIRQDPRCYISILQEHIKNFKQNVLYKSDNTPVDTYEGKAGYEDAIAFLQKQKAVDALNYDERLAKAALDHAQDIGARGVLTHASFDGKNLSDRIEMYMEWEKTCSENIDCRNTTGQDVIISLLVDDGMQERGQRKNLFKSELKYIGIGCAAHQEEGIVTVINYVGAIREKGKVFFDSNNFKYDFPKTPDSEFKREISAGSSLSNNEVNEVKPDNNEYQQDDPDAPNGTVAMKVVKTSRMYNDKRVRVTKKFYQKADGNQQVVELEEI